MKKKTKKWIAAALALTACLMVVGCGRGGRDAFGGETTDETVEKPDMINGFEEAVFEKFNSPAKENGLGGTPIYIEGKALTKITEEGVLAFTVEQGNGNSWVAYVTDEAEEDGKIVDDTIGRYVRVFGEYAGYSDVYEMPVLAMNMSGGKITVKSEDSGYQKVWDFDSYVDNVMEKPKGGSGGETGEEKLEAAEAEEVPLKDNQESEPFFTYSGSGDDVVSGVKTENISYAHITHLGEGHFSVKGHYGDDYDLLVNTTDPYDGATLIFPDKEYTFEVSSSGEWSMELYKIGTSSSDSFSGNGDYVSPIALRTSNVYEISTTGGGHIAIKAWGDSGSDLLVNTTDENYSGKVMLDSDEKYGFFEITSSREWEIRPSE